MTMFRELFVVWLLALAGQASAANLDPASDAFWYGTAVDGSPTVRLYYFFSPTCPHCQAAKPLIADFAARTPWLELRRYAVKDNRDNARFYYDTAKSLGVEALSVPGFVFCRQVRIGYDGAEATGAELIKALEACHAERVAHPGAASETAPTAFAGTAFTTWSIPGRSRSRTSNRGSTMRGLQRTTLFASCRHWPTSSSLRNTSALFSATITAPRVA